MRIQVFAAVLVLGVLAGCDCGNPPGPNTDGGSGGGAAGTGGGSGGGTANTGGGTANTGGGTANTGGGTGTLPDGGTCNAGQSCSRFSWDGGYIAVNCGFISDGCGNLIDCGDCTLPQTCGGDHVPNTCGGATGCIPKTCSDLGHRTDGGTFEYDCGLASDGCGGVLNCGTCVTPEICGGAGTPGQCGLTGSNLDDAGACIPTSCAIAGAGCGTIGNGCGGTLNCGTCATGTCGGSGTPYQCGASGTTCTPITCNDVGATCGSIGNGCSGAAGQILNCGTCTAPDTCGGGGVANRCGGGVVCTPQTQPNACAGKCGTVGDGCGGFYTCSACSTGVCGGGGVPNVCGGPSQVCPGGPPSNATVCNGKCGNVSDGCGNIVNCTSANGGQTCSGGQTCGGNGTANVCGGCAAKTCADLGKNCGQVANGCGALTASCGQCTGVDICGGAGVPNVCGAVIPALPCDGGLCEHQSTSTTLRGIVYAPTQADAGYGQPDPIPGAFVYIPNRPENLALLDGDGGVGCLQCADGLSGDPLVSANSQTNGSFTLTNVPCGVDVPLVIQLGKWRRYVTIPAAQAVCGTNIQTTQEQTRLPRKFNEFNAFDSIPKIAILSGSVDTIECVLPKIGIAADQFGNPADNKRITFYRDNGGKFNNSTPAATTLWDSLEEMRKYDMIVIDCVGGEQTKTVTRRQNLEAYTSAGGRVFASHFAYVWLYQRAIASNGSTIDVTTNPPAPPLTFPTTAQFNANQGSPADQFAYIDTSFPKGQTFSDWIQLVTNPPPAAGRIRINVVRRDMNSVNNSTSTPPAQRWVWGTSGSTTNIPLQYTFNTPTTAAPVNQCGRVLFSDFHVIDASVGNSTWPYCAVGSMSQQEKVFEYLIFDLSACVAPDVPPQTCTPKTCNDLPGVCGPQSDGCGNTLNCSCTGGATCDTAHGTCCQPTTCAAQGANCGTISNACGGSLNCGTCSSGTCGGGGTANVCGGGTCQALTCNGLGYNCGQWGNGCGTATLNCGTCQPGQTCGGGGVTGQCGGGTCTALTCTQQGFNCGMQGNGCGATQDCGSCPAGQACGVNAPPGVCGTPTPCVPKTCANQGFNCGAQGDGCGGQIDCGQCPAGQVCGASGPGLCGAVACTPLTCQQQGLQCGTAGDGCGNLIFCGSCQPGQTCGGGGVPGQCGTPACTPRSCAQFGYNCGQAGDGCGGVLDCGICSPTESCGGGGQANVCGGIR